MRKFHVTTVPEAENIDYPESRRMGDEILNLWVGWQTGFKHTVAIGREISNILDKCEAH